MLTDEDMKRRVLDGDTGDEGDDEDDQVWMRGEDLRCFL